MDLCLRLTVDSVDQKYRTVWWYAFVALLDHVTHVIFLLRGFEYYAQSQAKPVFPPRIQQVFAKRRSTAGSLSYWHRPHRSTGLPVVFFHGIGVGLGPYIRFLTEVAGGNSNGQTGVIALEILPVCFRLTGPPLGKEAFLRQFKAILDRHAWSEFTLVSHSYGSILSTHAMRCPEIQARIPRAVLVDPVSIMLHLPDVAYNFTRRRPKTVNEWVMWYFAATDPGVAHCLGRYFFWRENAIWADELTGYGEVSDSASDERIKERRITVCLAELDLIVNTRAVARYLAGGDWTECPARLRGEQGRHNHVEPPNGPVQGVQSFNHRSSHSGINIIWLPEKDHAEVFFSGRDRARVVAVIRDYCRA
ncbi:Putative alpha/Beta hydrolase [Colletotrichum destructivum]|uniref:Alpha/Beta hydrolase n=1 Tax=Colletotrichum destructivum TaxID=34406 RepID=A0AAX4J1D3_9PEZI|nr:Putative alpha/Beta hydrolase [Colletotrichum destructivum]